MKPFRWCYSDSPKDKEKFYAKILASVRRRARKLGYAVGVHGSMRRDLDLIAAPWRPWAVQPETLAYSLWEAITHRRAAKSWRLHSGDTVWHGRVRYVLPVGKTAYVDLSIMKPAPSANAR